MAAQRQNIHNTTFIQPGARPPAAPPPPDPGKWMLVSVSGCTQYTRLYGGQPMLHARTLHTPHTFPCIHCTDLQISKRYYLRGSRHSDSHKRHLSTHIICSEFSQMRGFTKTKVTHLKTWQDTYSRLKKNVYKIILNYLPPFT